MRWDKGYANPWILVTNKADLTAEMLASATGKSKPFATGKSSGWQLKSTRIRCAKKLERFLTILALAQGVADAGQHGDRERGGAGPTPCRNAKSASGAELVQ